MQHFLVNSFEKLREYRHNCNNEQESVIYTRLKMKGIAQTQSFTDLIDSGYIYIDKTREISKLLMNRRVFISRPRRFGKSLMLDTIGTLFEQGTEPYFRGTWIYDKWTEERYPVLRLNFLNFSCTDYKEFCTDFDDTLSKFARLNGIDYVSKDLPRRSMISLFDSLRLKKQKIVILIDEYDAQLAANINNPELYEQFRISLRELYGAVKGEPLVRFLCAAGVTRLKDVSIFSAGSDILDVSYASEIATITGFTREEIGKYYTDYINLAVSADKGMPEKQVTDELRDQLLDRLAEEYDGYSFDETNRVKVFSTWSVNSFFLNVWKKGYVAFGNYWYENGGIPSILANYFKGHKLEVSDFNVPVYVETENFLNPSSLLSIDQNILMCQTGYLTLDSDLSGYSVILKTPNKEVQRALARLVSTRIFSAYLESKPDYRSVFYKGDAESIVSELNRMFNSLSYERYPIKNEKEVQNYIHVFMMGGNLPVSTEIQNAAGRSDIVIEYDRRRIVLELKYADTESECGKKLKEASEQIKSRKYGETLPSKPVLRLALVFNGDSKVRQFTRWSSVDESEPAS